MAAAERTTERDTVDPQVIQGKSFAHTRRTLEKMTRPDFLLFLFPFSLFAISADIYARAFADHLLERGHPRFGNITNPESTLEFSLAAGCVRVAGCEPRQEDMWLRPEVME